MSEDCSACRRRQRRRESRQTEPEDVARAVSRLVRALGKRAAGDQGALPMIAALAGEVDQALHFAVRAGIAKGWWTYADVGRELGVTRQAALKRFSRPRELVEQS